MAPLLARVLRRLRVAAGGDVEATLASAVAVVVAIVTVVWPLASATHPPMTDLPMHAAQTSALRHYWDPSWHFADQFELRPVAVPYVTTYALGALFMLVLSPSVAVRAATACALLLLPLGVAVLARGMRKSPLLGLAAAPLAWSHLVHWGFINFVAALGLFAMAIGLALRVVDRPSRGRAVALAACLVMLFFTHIFRVPFAVLAVAVAAVVAAWAVVPAEGGALVRARAMARRIAPVALALLPTLALFVLFLQRRPGALTPPAESLIQAPDLARVKDVVSHVVGGFVDRSELDAARVCLGIAAAVALATLAFRIARPPARPAEEVRFRRAAALAVALVTLGLALGYLVLPFQIGLWWYVFPREATAVLVLAAALLPDVPRTRGGRVLVVAALSVSALVTARVPARHFARFERTTADFRAIATRVPHAPKLLYLIFDHRGTARLVTPFIHLPAWIQAEKGGWLAFHFAIFDASPFGYRRDPGATVAPAVPLRWEWEPDKFDLHDHQDFFDWFLVRASVPPDVLFASDPAIERVAHEGSWWLFRKRR